jgi:hypothetical protein
MRSPRWTRPERAAAAGVERFIVTTLAVDVHARRLLTRVAEPIGEHDQDGVIETTARLRVPARGHPTAPDTPRTPR